MGFLKNLFSAFTVDIDEEIKKMEQAKVDKFSEHGLRYKHVILNNEVIGIENFGKEIRSFVLEDRIRFVCSNCGDVDVMFEDIVSINVMNDIQIEEKSKLGEMIVLGIFALGTKRKINRIIKNKLVININEDDISYSLIIDTIHDALSEARKLNQVINNYKIESSI